MLLKLITKFLRPLGIIFLILFSVFLMIGSAVKDFGDRNVFYEYTNNIENRFYDIRMKSQLNQEARSKEIVLVEIDDASLQSIGSWPLPRSVHADMISRLAAFGVKVAALDILYPERSPNAKYDDLLANSFREFQKDDRRIFISYTTVPADEGHEVLEEAPVEMLNDTIQIRTASDANLRPMKVAKFTFPIPEFVETEVGLGTINMGEDKDGIFRRYLLVSNVDTIYFGSLGLNAYEAYTGEKVNLDVYSDGTGKIKFSEGELDVGHSGDSKVRWVGASQYFPSISLHRLLEAPLDDPELRELLHGKIAFVGSSATGAHDLRSSPIDPKMPGVYVHMNFAHMLLHQNFYRPPNESIQISFVFLVVGMVIFLLIQRIGNAFLDTLTVGLMIVAAYYLDSVYFLPKGYELRLFYCFFCFTSSYSWNTFIQFYQASKEKRQIKGTFSRYVAPTVVEEMLKDPSKLQVGGTKMDITCLFSDVRDFTSISESLSANDLAQSMNMYMTAMTDIVFETKGTLDKYIGDAIVAIWGAPLPIGNHAQHAVEAAVKMMNALPTVNAEFRKLGRPDFKVGIGLNSGECSVGNMGSTRIFSYTALGDNMNLGARVESLCKRYGAQILITDFTLERLDLANIRTRPVDQVVVKGKSVPVGIHEVLFEHHWLWSERKCFDSYHRGHAHFLNEEFQQALDDFHQVLAVNPEDKATKRFSLLCEKYIENPQEVPENFAVTVMTEK